MAKIFLTVVGTGDYSPTEYRLGDTVYKKERYVQKALLSMLKDKGEHFDRIVFFLTARAREKNWEQFTAARPNIDGEKETDEGLKPFLEKNFSGIYEALDICEGKNEHELLELFNSMFDAIGENDEITFDITHGFRFIPFLFFPVMSYAKELI
ncbi:MAG: CRISPR-associated DxTHG motif protein [Ruminococcus sp.]|nr:CRISPR-associated DxTHG motif protein [Ruminococcus sp.]